MMGGGVGVCVGWVGVIHREAAARCGHTRNHVEMGSRRREEGRERGGNLLRATVCGEDGHFWKWSQQIYRSMSNIDLNQPQSVPQPGMERGGGGQASRCFAQLLGVCASDWAVRNKTALGT